MGDIPWFRVKDEGGLARLETWPEIEGCNTFSPRTDKNGKPFFFLGYDSKPDSDWGRYKGHRAAVWCETDDLARKAEDIIRVRLWGANALQRRDAYNAGVVYGYGGGEQADNPHDWNADRQVAESWREGFMHGGFLKARGVDLSETEYGKRAEVKP